MLKKILFIFCFLFSSIVYAESQFTVTIPFSPGGGIDSIFRRLQEYTDNINIKLTPEYRPGANGIIGVNSVVNGKDFAITTTDSVALYMYQNNIKIDPSFIIPVQKSIFGIVSNSQIPLKELLKNKITVGYTTISHKILIELIMKHYGYTHDLIFVPYKNTGDLLSNTVNGDVKLSVGILSTFVPLLKSNKLKLIAHDNSTGLVEFPESISVYNFDKDIPLVNPGSILLFSKNTSNKTLLEWQKIINLFQQDQKIKEDLRLNFASPVAKKTKKEILQDLEFSMKMIENYSNTTK